ncbi:hypothetical protein AAKU67_002153 [Oxalobacteraceae bacterium GrIS 2.11]
MCPKTGSSLTVLSAFVLCLSGCTGGSDAIYTAQPTVQVDPASRDKIDQAIQLHQQYAGNDKGLVAAISAEFLGTPYVANTLIGSLAEPERLVVNFNGVDCFTYLDYVAALIKSDSPASFENKLIEIRYKDGAVSFLNRKHFFTDWAWAEPINALDVSAKLSPRTVTVAKTLNLKADGSVFLPGLGITQRQVTYIPAENIDDAVIAQLQTGDYIGIYSHVAGLDVSHTGLFIQSTNGPQFRNASSLAVNQKVVDSDFKAYVQKTPGIVVLR